MGHPVQPPAQAGSPRAGGTGPCPGGSWISPGKETPQPPWAAWARAPSPSEGRSSSSCPAGASSASVCARCPLSCRWAPLKRVWPRPPDRHPSDIYNHLQGHINHIKQRGKTQQWLLLTTSSVFLYLKGQDSMFYHSICSVQSSVLKPRMCHEGILQLWAHSFASAMVLLVNWKRWWKESLCFGLVGNGTLNVATNCVPSKAKTLQKGVELCSESSPGISNLPAFPKPYVQWEPFLPRTLHSGSQVNVRNITGTFPMCLSSKQGPLYKMRLLTAFTHPQFYRNKISYNGRREKLNADIALTIWCGYLLHILVFQLVIWNLILSQLLLEWIKFWASTDCFWKPTRWNVRSQWILFLNRVFKTWI